MNIFALSTNALEAAKFHCDKHVVKMILEYAQILSTVHRVLDGKQVTKLSATGRKTTGFVIDGPMDSILYKTTHINHPSTVWARQTSGNYIWLATLLFHLCQEYTHRYGKVHLTEQKGLPAWFLDNLPKNITHAKVTPVTPAMPDECKVGTSVESYHRYYNDYKRHMFSWKNRPVPPFIETQVLETL